MNRVFDIAFKLSDGESLVRKLEVAKSSQMTDGSVGPITIINLPDDFLVQRTL